MNRVERFIRSDEYRAADGLIQAFEHGSEEELAEVTKMQVFKYLPNQVSVLVRKLKFPDDIIQDNSGASSSKGGRHHKGQEDEEPDLT